MFSASPRIGSAIGVLHVIFNFAIVLATRLLGKIVLHLLLVIVFETFCVFVNKGEKKSGIRKVICE